MLQCNILYYYSDSGRSQELVDLGIDITGIGISLMFALLHTIIEGVYLKLEAIACKTSMTHYTLVCFNGRFGWIPFTNKFKA